MKTNLIIEKNFRRIMSNNQTDIFAPPQVYSSTMFRYAEEYCDKAMDFHLQGLQENTEKYQLGNAAHFVLEQVGREKAVAPKQVYQIARKTAGELIENGYVYFGKKQPPFKPVNAFDGMDLALAYLKTNSLPLNGEYEIVLAMDRQGRPCALENPSCRWRAKIDLYWTREEEDENLSQPLKIGVVTDYKSAWPTGEKDLETWQRKSQMVLAWLHHPELDGVRAEVINLRTHKVYSKTVFFDEDGMEQLSRWRDEILALCDKMDKNREAQPGVGCETCPFTAHCEVALKVAAAKENAAAYAVLENQRENLRKIIKQQLAEADGIACNGGFIGYDRKLRTVLKPAATAQILAAWYRKPLEEVAGMTRESSLLEALGLGTGNLDKFIERTLSDASETERREFFELCAEQEYRAEFGIHKRNGGNGQADLKLLPADIKLPAAAQEKKKPARSKVKLAKLARPVKKRKVKKAAKKKPVAKKMAKPVRKIFKHKKGAVKKIAKARAILKKSRAKVAKRRKKMKR